MLIFIIAKKCNYKISNNSFEGNLALFKGGAISYDKYRPQSYNNNTFDIYNYARYGSQIAGYPFGVKVISYDKYVIASG